MKRKEGIEFESKNRKNRKNILMKKLNHISEETKDQKINNIDNKSNNKKVNFIVCYILIQKYKLCISHKYGYYETLIFILREMNSSSNF